MERININNFKQFAGYILEDKQLHVCGYDGNNILIQQRAGAKMQKLKLNYNDKGVFFTLNGKRNYIIKK